ncbi:MAG: DUF2333 family protein [Mariprofundaceae bacterium]|nr:DUF2333 family protein [Mariprofundaceae bacterium]
MDKQRILQITGLAMVLLLLGMLVLMIFFSVQSTQLKVEPLPHAGTTYTQTMHRLINTELSSFSGWVPNDISPPSIFLDNKPNFQLGVLETLRYSSRVLRDNLSRQRTTDNINIHVKEAFELLSNDATRWVLPSAENRYHEAAKQLQEYQNALANEDPKASFFPRSDNLIQLLEQYSSLLGSTTNRLLQASSDMQAIDLDKGQKQQVHVPWYEIDDRYYMAKGVGYSLHAMYQSLYIEFIDVLKDKHAEALFLSIIESLKYAYFEPTFITNGDSDGLLANHNNNIRVFLDDARQKNNSLIAMLDQG